MAEQEPPEFRSWASIWALSNEIIKAGTGGLARVCLLRIACRHNHRLVLFETVIQQRNRSTISSRNTEINLRSMA